MTTSRSSGRFLLAVALAGGALSARPSVESNASSSAALALARAVERPDDAGRANDLGNQLLLSGENAAAEAAYRRAIELDPKAAAPHYNLGRLLLEERRRFSARRELGRALELDPDHAAARFYLGVADDELGFDRRARRSYRRAFELQPSLADPRQNPELARRRNALHALIESWKDEPLVTLANETAEGRPVLGAKPAAVEGEPFEPHQPITPPAAAEETTGGGYARVTGGERTARELAADGGAVDADASGSPADRAARRERASGAAGVRRNAAGEQVIDASDLAGRSFVNQVVEPGATRGGKPRPSGRPTKPSRAPGSRFNPPPRPFVPDEESTGRIEPLLVPAASDRFAIGR